MGFSIYVPACYYPTARAIELRWFRAVFYDPEATAPEFIACLERYWPDRAGKDKGITDCLLQSIGYSLSGLNKEKRFFLLHGTANTGKTTLMNALGRVFGDYFKYADWSTFAAQRDADGTRHRTDLARLMGARIVSVSEGDEGGRMAEGLIKRITGRTPIVVRDLMSKPVEIIPTFKLWFDTNHLPRFSGNDRATWTRLMRIPFRITFSPEERIDAEEEGRDLDEILASEASGILNLAIQGWKTYLERGTIIMPHTLRQAAHRFEQNEDTFGQFLIDHYDQIPGEIVEKGALHRHYCEWIGENMGVPPSAKRLGLWMLERGFEESRRAKVRYWIGLKPKGVEPDEGSTVLTHDA